jgi:hypothetical protein
VVVAAVAEELEPAAPARPTPEIAATSRAGRGGSISFAAAKHRFAVRLADEAVRSSAAAG